MSRDSSLFRAGGKEPSKPRVHPLDWAREARAVELVERAMHAGVRRRRQRAAGAVAALAVIVAAAVTWLPGEKPAAAGTPASPPLLVAVPARQMLPDGSSAELKDGARISNDFSGAVRRVTLHRGEAHFQVVANPLRPFVVTAQGVEVRAVGTAFSVQLEREAVGVLVTSGRVAVESATVASPASPASSAAGRLAAEGPLFLEAGAGVVVENPGTPSQPTHVRSVPAAEFAERLAWRVPRLELNSARLTEVLAVFHQHTARRVVLADAALGELKLSGVLRADNLPVLLKILETSYGLTVDHSAEDEILVRRGR